MESDDDPIDPIADLYARIDEANAEIDDLRAQLAVAKHAAWCGGRDAAASVVRGKWQETGFWFSLEEQILALKSPYEAGNE